MKWISEGTSHQENFDSLFKELFERHQTLMSENLMKSLQAFEKAPQMPKVELQSTRSIVLHSAYNERTSTPFEWKSDEPIS